MAGVGAIAHDDVILERLRRRLYGDMVLTYPRRAKGSDKIEAWLADEVRDAIDLITRQALALRELTQEKAQLLDELAAAHAKLKALGGGERPGDKPMVRTEKQIL